MNDFFDQVYYNNTVGDYLIALAIIVGGIIVVLAFKTVIIHRLQAWAAKTPGTWDDFIVESFSRFVFPILMWTIVYWGIHTLELSDKTERTIRIATSIILTYYFLRLISSVVTTLLKSGVRKREHGEEKIKQLGGLLMVINIIIWFLGLVFLLSNWGIEVTPIIAGLGIGGIAVALAAQNILGDLFGYFVIFFDRPFEAGDFIIVDDKMGTIEYVGIKTTHIRALSGEQIIIGNANLTSSRIHNYKRMLKRRVVFTLNVDYGTPAEKLQRIPAMLKSLIEQEKLVTFDRAHFAAYHDWSLRFEIVYYVLSADFNVYMDIQQRINIGIYQLFETQQIAFALPTRSLLIRQETGLAPPPKGSE
ncbi:MAG TPA: mechanosensitive ion channel family protein [Chryseosolibacter sp.]|nr:mechanosensitive ion channel family protein [Chryseosolibacter sp.]